MMSDKINTLKEQLELIARDAHTREEFEASIKKFLACSNLNDSSVEFQYLDVDLRNIARADILVQCEAGDDSTYIALETSSKGVYLS